MEEKALTVLKRRVLETAQVGTSSVSAFAAALNTPKKDLEKDVKELVASGYLKEGGILIFKTYSLTTEGLNQLGSPKLEMDAIRESTILKSGAYSRLTLTARSTGAATAANGSLRIIFPKQMNLLRQGAKYAAEPEHFVLDYPLNPLAPGETQSVIFDLVGTLPTGVVSTKYKLTIQALLGQTVTDKKEVSIYIETQDRYGALL